MKRIKEACICQTLHFMLKEDVGHDYAVRVVQEEIKKYKESLDKKRLSTRSLRKQNSLTVQSS